MSVCRTRLVGAVSLLLLAGGGLTACDAGDVPGASALGGGGSPAADAPTPSAPLRLTSNIKRGAREVPVDTRLALAASGGTIDRVRVSSDAGRLAGRLAADGASWRAEDLLEPGSGYVVKVAGTDEGGERVSRTIRFSTEDLNLDEQTYASVAPLDGETVGVGMPVVVSFDLPVTDRAEFERHMRVTSTPAQPGSWHWLSDTEVRWRPKRYWRAGTDVHVEVDINGVAAGNGIYGQQSRELDFHVGDSHIYKVDMRSHQMRAFSNGRLLRTIPITTGKQPEFTTRSGVKVIIEKFASKDMNSETVGIKIGRAHV